MTPKQWAQVKEGFHAATELPPDERALFTRQHCNGDAEVLRELELLLASHDDAEDFIERPALVSASEILSSEAGSSWVGRSIGPYRVEQEIGRGGMGLVLLATRADDHFNKRVAIKLIKRGMDTEDILRRFRNERQILASLEHPNIARLIDGGMTDEGLPYFVLEYVEGEPLARYCDQHGLGTVERLNIFRKVCGAVQYAHQNLIVHRDLKPTNILVSSEGEPKLLDFGIAKLLGSEMGDQNIGHTMTSMRLMTPDYASPEQVRGEHVTTATDIYSLGVVLYELLAGVRPFRSKDNSADGLSRAICDSEPAKPSDSIVEVGLRNAESKTNSISIRNPKALRGDLDNIALMALRKEPSRRYASAAEFSADIQRHLDGLPVIARKDTFKYRATKFVQRNRIGVAAAALILVTLVTGVAMTVRERRKADRRFNDVRQMANSLIFEVDDEIQKGSTKGRAMLAKRALEYLDSLASEAGNEPGLQLELAAGYLKVGDIQGKPYRPNLGDTAGALVSYRKAQTLLESLTAASPVNLEARRYLSLSYQNIGRLLQRSGEWNAGLESERKAVAVSEALLAIDSSNPQYRSLVADNYLRLGEALYQAERGATVADHHQAIAYFRKALEMHTALAAAEPGNAEYQYAAGVDYEFVGIAFNKLGDLTGDAENHRSALENHLKELEINEGLASSDPTNAAYRRILADVYGEVGLSHLRLGKTAESLENFRHKLAIFESIRTSDPTNVEARRDVAYAYREFGSVLAQVGDLSEALAQDQKAVAILQALREAEPANTETRVNLLYSYEASGEIQTKTGDHAAALETYQTALALLESWSSAEPASVTVQRFLAIEYANIAKVHQTAAANPKASLDKQRAGWRAALDGYRRSLGIWDQLRTQGRLSEADATKPSELANEIAKCESALTQR